MDKHHRCDVPLREMNRNVNVFLTAESGDYKLLDITTKGNFFLSNNNQLKMLLLQWYCILIMQLTCLDKLGWCNIADHRSSFC